MLHGQFNNSLMDTHQPTKYELQNLPSLYDINLFDHNSILDSNISPYENLHNNQINSRYFSPHAFHQAKSKWPNKITNANLETSAFNIPGYRFEFVPTPLAFGGVRLFIDEQYNCRVIKKTANNEFQALWIEISYVKKKKNIICAVMHRQHNNSDRFLQYFEDSVEKYSATGKQS